MCILLSLAFTSHIFITTSWHLCPRPQTMAIRKWKSNESLKFSFPFHLPFFMKRKIPFILSVTFLLFKKKIRFFFFVFFCGIFKHLSLKRKSPDRRYSYPGLRSEGCGKRKRLLGKFPPPSFYLIHISESYIKSFPM